METKPNLPPPGEAFYFDGYKYHIIGYIQDGNETLVVLKYYGKNKRWWHYEVWTEFQFGIRTKSNK